MSSIETRDLHQRRLAGVRSAYVCKFLAAQGFAHVMNLRGGITQWALQVDPDMPMY